MVKKALENGNYKNILIGIAITIIAWLSVNQYIMPDKFVRAERYVSDQTRIEKQLTCIQVDIKEILKTIK